MMQFDLKKFLKEQKNYKQRSLLTEQSADVVYRQAKDIRNQYKRFLELYGEWLKNIEFESGTTPVLDAYKALNQLVQALENLV
jgi:hypothetical protein